MRSEFYNPKLAFCNTFCPFREGCSNAVCPVVKYNKAYPDTEVVSA